MEGEPSNPLNDIPAYHRFFNPILKVLKTLGGSGSIKELDEKVTEYMGLPEEVLEKIHDPETGNETEVEYRLAWARTYLKKYGLINNSSRGIWSLTDKAENVHEVDPDDVRRYARSVKKKSRAGKVVGGETANEAVELVASESEPWRVQLYKLLTKELEPAAFERLVQRLLRESGFIQVEVTGRTGDGGIDGKGIARIHGLMSFHVVFQCKRYRGTVSASEIRDFRGAMVGRADKGLFITTGSYSREAIKEATRDGAPPIDLLDGDSLAEKLRELRLGVTVEVVEKITIESDWFKSI